MELKRADILGKKLGRCFACNKQKEVLICKEKSTGKILNVCEDCIREAGEKEVFLSGSDAIVFRNKWFMAGIKLALYAVLATFLLIPLQLFGVFASVSETTWMYLNFAWWGYLALILILFTIGYVTAPIKPKLFERKAMKDLMKVKPVNFFENISDRRVKLFLKASVIFFFVSAASFFFVQIKYFFYIYLWFLNPFFAIVASTNGDYFSLLVLVLPYLAAMYTQWKATSDYSTIDYVPGKSLFVQGKPLDIVYRTNNRIGILVGIFIIFVSLNLIFLWIGPWPLALRP